LTTVAQTRIPPDSSGWTKVQKKVETLPKGRMLDEAIDIYCKNLQIKAHQTFLVYSRALVQFYDSTKNKPISEICEQDLINFEIFMKNDGMAERTCSNSALSPAQTR
jgi:hypothetical protein